MNVEPGECPHGGDAAICPPCQRKPRRHSEAKPGPSFSAAYPGQCAGCDLPIYVGQQVAKWPAGGSGHGRTLHATCTP